MKDINIEREQLHIACNGFDGKISILAGGNGPTVLLLHGLMHSARRWGNLVETFSNGFRLYAPDLPGFGYSPPIRSQRIDLDTYAHILECLCAKLSNGREFHAVVADSLSGILVLKLLQRRKVLARRILLSGVPTSGIPSLSKLAAHPKLFSLSLSALRLLPSKIASRFIILGSFITVQNYKDIDEAFIDGVLEADPKTTSLLLKGICETRFDLVTYPDNLQIMIVRGERDKIASRKGLEQLAHHLRASYHELKNSGHTPMLESPQEFNRLVGNLLYAPQGGESEWTEQLLQSNV